MRFYKFAIQNSKKERVLPFLNSHYFWEYTLEKNMKVKSYEIVHRHFKLSKKHMLSFVKDLISLLENQVDIILSLEILSNQEEGIFSAILWNIRKEIVNGNTMNYAFRRYEEIFPTIFLNLLSIGERGNKVSENLKRAYKTLKFNFEMREKIKEVSFYPAIVGCFLSLLVVFIFTCILPNFASFFEEAKIELPLVTKLLLMVSRNFKIILLATLIAIVAVVIISKKIGKESKERIKLGVPGIRFFVINRAVSEFSQNFSLLLESDENILEIMEIIKNTTEYIFMKKDIEKAKRSIRNGESIYSSLKKMKIFSKEQLRLIKIGERTQTLAKTFEVLANVAQKKIESRLLRITTFIQPVLLGIIGVIIGVVISAIYLPIFSITSNII